MKHIIKAQEPSSFTQWKNQENDQWQANYKNLSGDVKQDIKKSLMIEQGYLCCYCESKLEDNNSHIEHFKPRKKYPDEELNFSNLLCSCLSNLTKGDPNHCGNLKSDYFDEKLLISPTDQECENSFKYTGDGYIEPKNSQDKPAVETIKILGLNITKLIADRSEIINVFLDPDINQFQFQEFVIKYLQKDEEGKFRPFWSTIKYIFLTE